jgi:hypothetical protein
MLCDALPLLAVPVPGEVPPQAPSTGAHAPHASKNAQVVTIRRFMDGSPPAG